MRSRLAATLIVLLVGASCAGGTGSEEHVVRVDFTHDEFASHYWRYFPRTVFAHAGDEVVFRQEWTGEQHSVTFGRLVDAAIPRIQAVEKKFETADLSSPEALAKAEAEYADEMAGLPVFDPYKDVANPAASQPCYLGDDAPRDVPADACPQRAQPVFDGTHSVYSSGFIAPSGDKSNVYRVPLSEDLEPGSYRFYCNVHFPDMQGLLVVNDPDEALPSAEDVAARARSEIEELATPLRRAFAQAKAGKARGPNGERLALPVAGYHAGDEYTVAVDEFVPKIVTAKIDEPITWTITGAHTVSFDVPRYRPIYRVRKDGTVVRNPVVDKAAGGSPKAAPVDFESGPLEIDGGTWDGDGFISSGLLGSEPFAKYTLRVSKAGRYRYACLIHPKMVGTLVVS